MILPKLTLRVRVSNPDWTSSLPDSYYIIRPLECEVLTLHLRTGMMRVRYQWQGKTETLDLDATAFWDKYQLEKK